MRKNKNVPNKEVDMTSIADSSVIIQTSSESVPSTPSWFGEIALIIPYLRKQGVLAAISSQVRLARRRFGHYEVIDFLAILFGYAISGEHTLEEFYEQLLPFAQPFMALFDRERLPSRSALSRFLASFTWEATEALRTLFLADLLARPLDTERHTGQLVDRTGNARVVFDKALRPTEQRREVDGSLRVLYSARILDCRGCPKRPQCQWHGEATTKPRQVSVLLHPLRVGPAPLLWRDWSRREHRRACMQLVRQQRIEVSLSPPGTSPPTTDVILSRAQRAHSRLSWAERLARNARPPT